MNSCLAHMKWRSRYLDGEGSRVTVLWDDRGEVAKAFDVGIFSNFCNL